MTSDRLKEWSAAHEAGEAARYRGEGRGSNPFTKGRAFDSDPLEASAWDQGWADMDRRIEQSDAVEQ